MAYEFLKKLFGTVDGQPQAMTYEQLEAAIDADKKLKIVNLSDGEHVAKSKLDAKIAELEGVRQQLDDANKEIKSYKDMDIDGIKQSAADWEAKYNTDTQALNDKLAQQAREHAEDMFMSGYKFTSKAARNGVLNELRAKQFKLDNGILLGGKEFMQTLMEDEDYKGAFAVEKKEPEEPQPNIQKPRFAGSTAGDNGGNGGDDKPIINFGFNRIRQPKA